MGVSRTLPLGVIVLVELCKAEILRDENLLASWNLGLAARYSLWFFWGCCLIGASCKHILSSRGFGLLDSRIAALMHLDVLEIRDAIFLVSCSFLACDVIQKLYFAPEL